MSDQRDKKLHQKMMLGRFIQEADFMHIMRKLQSGQAFTYNEVVAIHKLPKIEIPEPQTFSEPLAHPKSAQKKQ